MSLYNHTVAVLYIIFCLVDVIGSSLMLLALFKDRKLRTLNNMYLASLAIADILFGVFNMPISAAVLLLKLTHINIYLCNLAGTLTHIAMVASLYTLACASFDRFLLICHPHYYKAKMNKNIITVIITGVWALSTILGTLPVTGISDYEFIPSTSMCGLRTAIKNTTSNGTSVGMVRDYYFLCYFLLTFPIPLLVVFFSYSYIGKTILEHQNVGNFSSQRHSSIMNGTFVVLLLVIVFFVCNLPPYIVILLFWAQTGSGNGPPTNAVKNAGKFLVVLLRLKFPLDPILYGLMNRKIRMSFLKLIQDRKERYDSNSDNDPKPVSVYAEESLNGNGARNSFKTVVTTTKVVKNMSVNNLHVQKVFDSTDTESIRSQMC